MPSVPPLAHRGYCHRACSTPGYYEGSEDYFTHNFYGNGLDFHQEDQPNCSIASGCSKLVWEAIGPGNCSRIGNCTQPDYWNSYSTHLFTARAVQIIDGHAKEAAARVLGAGAAGAAAGAAGAAAGAGLPLFLYLAYQGVHEPRQAPARYVAAAGGAIDDPGRTVFAGMLSAVDEGVANVTAALKAANMYESTLFIVTTDNGGPTTECSGVGQSNYPLRGSKCTIWEGGTRGEGFLFWAGLPAVARGLRYGGLVHAADWLPTIYAAVGLGSAVPAGTTLPLDGINVWDALLSNATSPRTQVYYGTNQQGKGPAVRDVSGFKMILSDSGGGQGAWSPEQYPNRSFARAAAAPSRAAPPHFFLAVHCRRCRRPTTGVQHAD